MIDGFFNFTLVLNRGAAFGLFSSIPDPWRGIVLSVTSIIALVFVAFLLTKDFRHNQAAHAALGMIVGGGVGNAIDRIQHGAVVDFLDFYFGNYHWPAFNVADSAIFVGVAILLFLGSQKPQAQTVGENKGPTGLAK
jgi:signal peptidase II